jgi:hypothetical protein
MEQEKTDFPFKLLNGLADGGLGNPQDVGRPRGRTIGHNGVENLDLSNVHNHNPDEWRTSILVLDGMGQSML